VEDCHHMLISEGVLSLIFWGFVGAILLWSSFSIYFQYWCIKRFSRVMAFAIDSPPAFGSGRLKLFSRFLSYLSLLDKLLLCIGLDDIIRTFTLSRKLCLHVCSNMDKGMPV